MARGSFLFRAPSQHLRCLTMGVELPGIEDGLMELDAEVIDDHIEMLWTTEVVPVLHEYIAIPNKSPSFDPEWASRGHMDTATELLRGWAASRSIPGLKVDVHRLDGRTPVIVCEIPPTDDCRGERTVLLYGHLDKQPEMEGWDDDKGPWQPVMVGERLYGRGGADDGYSVFSALTAIEALQEAEGSHARCVVLIEASEESGSPDLPAYVDHLTDFIGDVDLVICLDSGAATDDQLWVTTSLRGLTAGVLDVRIVEEGLHSGAVGGVVPSSFRILRSLLSRVEDEATGEVLLPELNVDIPVEAVAAATASADVLADDVAGSLPFTPGARPVSDDIAQLILNRTWRPALSVIGIDGAPKPGDAGNVLRPNTTAKLSFRLPPTADPDLAFDAVRDALTSDPPYGAEVTFGESESGPGWAAPAVDQWLAEALDVASSEHFGKPAGFQGEGGSIPFMGMLGEKFPDAQFVITGVLVPGSNAHGPNEFLDLPTAKRVTGCVSQLLHAHAAQSSLMART